MSEWFSVDRKGLRKLVESRGMNFALFELYQNSRDEASKSIDIVFGKVDPIRAPKVYEIRVTDDNPNGFSDLTHAFTLFAESSKKGNPEQAGRFNLGEKLVLSMCSMATITTTTGQVVFESDGTRRKGRTKTYAGTEFRGFFDCINKAAYDKACREFRKVIPKPGVTVTFNGETIPEQTPIKTFEATLETQIAGDDGVLRPTKRKTTVSVYETRDGESAMLYELGIPVVETGDRWHVDISQKVPLNMDRDNVRPNFLRSVRVAVLNAMHDQITEADTVQTWVKESIEDKRCTPEAITTFAEKAYGKDRVVFDPSDPEANMIAVSKGYRVVYGSQLPAGAWENIRSASAILPAGRVTPSPKPYSDDGVPLEDYPESKWTVGIRNLRDYAIMLGKHLLDRDIIVRIVNDSKWGFHGTYGPGGTLVINIGSRSKDWFETIGEHTDDFLLHEFGHNTTKGCNHLDEAYHKNLTSLGSKLARLCLEQPYLFCSYRPVHDELYSGG